MQTVQTHFRVLQMQSDQGLYFSIPLSILRNNCIKGQNSIG